MQDLVQTSYILIDGKKVSTDIKNEIAEAVALRKQEGKKIPHLAIILVGDDGASQTYVDNKVKSCKAVGFHYTMMRFADTIAEDKLMKHITRRTAMRMWWLIVQGHYNIYQLKITEKIRSDKVVTDYKSQLPLHHFKEHVT